MEPHSRTSSGFVRYDRLTGVENCAQWIVRGIREESFNLASVGDSGELRRVPAEYARERLQLAYASVVHGVQGDTADASVVGPDVDAAGLDVGLTRGRVLNIAIVVAGMGAGARECLAESMQRGTPELTMQEAVRAAQAELRRAARDREAALLPRRRIWREVRRAGSAHRSARSAGAQRASSRADYAGLERLAAIYPNLPASSMQDEFAKRVTDAGAEPNARLDPLFKQERRRSGRSSCGSSLGQRSWSWDGQAMGPGVATS